MKLRRFEGHDVNGYMNFSIDFNSELTFLTGINGSGKTSVLNSITALLMPRLDYLAGDHFSSISVNVENNGEPVLLAAVKDDVETTLSCSLFPGEHITFEAVELPSDFPSYKLDDFESEYYKELMTKHSRHPVMKYIQSLPTPMFLGLDRRSRSVDFDHFNRIGPRRVRNLRRRNIFSTSLAASLSEAQYFAEDRFRKNLGEKAALDAQFREDLVLELLNFPPIDFPSIMADETLVDPVQLKKAKENIYKIPKLLRVPDERIVGKLDTLFEFIKKKWKSSEAILTISPAKTCGRALVLRQGWPWLTTKRTSRK